MKKLIALFVAGLAFAATAQERPGEIDPNTKIQGGADVRGSGASAGAGAQTESRTEAEKPPFSAPPAVHSPERIDRSDAAKDKPISERKPQERAREDASQGETAKKPQQ